MIVTARRLAVANRTKPRQSDLKRSISTAYYALFHAIAKDAADLLVGAGTMRARTGLGAMSTEDWSMGSRKMPARRSPSSAFRLAL